LQHFGSIAGVASVCKALLCWLEVIAVLAMGEAVKIRYLVLMLLLGAGACTDGQHSSGEVVAEESEPRIMDNEQVQNRGAAKN